MRGHLLFRPHVCDVSSSYSANQTLKIAFSIDTFSSFLYRRADSKRTASSHKLKETVAAVVGAGPPENRATLWRPIFYYSRPDHAGDIIVPDLPATLDRHQSTNRASIIRPVKSNATGLPLFHRPQIDYLRPQVTVDLTESEHIGSPAIIHVGSKDPGPQAIAKAKLKSRHYDAPKKESTVGRTQQLMRSLKKPVQLDARSWNKRGEQIEDYKGLSLRPAEQWSMDRSDMERPWLDYLPDETGESYSRLRAEILAFYAFISPSPDEDSAYKKLIADVQNQARTILPHYPLEVIGSQRTGLATSLSDLDFRLSLPEYEKPVNERAPSTTRPEARKESIRQLEKLILGLSASRNYENVVLRGGRIPIISGVHRATQITIQIQAMSDSSASREYVLNYLAEFPTLRPLYALIKTTLEIRNLRDVVVGGLGAYSTFMLLVAGLKQSEGAIARNDIALQLLSCLDFFAETDLHRHGISVDPPGLFRKVYGQAPSNEATLADPILRGQARIAKVHEEQPYLLCLQDPANPLNDLGARAYNIKHVQALFRIARSKLWTLFRTFDYLPPSKVTSRNFAESAMLDGLVGADYGWFQLRRDRIARWGRLPSQTGA